MKGDRKQHIKNNKQFKFALESICRSVVQKIVLPTRYSFKSKHNDQFEISLLTTIAVVYLFYL